MSIGTRPTTPSPRLQRLGAGARVPATLQTGDGHICLQAADS